MKEVNNKEPTHISELKLIKMGKEVRQSSLWKRIFLDEQKAVTETKQKSIATAAHIQRVIDSFMKIMKKGSLDDLLDKIWSSALA